jgi:NADPH:quinone reductase-like Zn-dependent oxidoreductase
MAGVVVALGDGVEDLAVGDKVASFPAESPNDYPVYGEQIVLPRSALTRYPDVLTPIEASVHYTPLLIAYFAYVDLARVKPGQFALVTDASHCAGPSFVQLGKALGVRVIAATKDSAEREYLLSLGAEKVIATEEQDLLMQINKFTDNRGVDVVFDGLGGPQMSLLGDVLAPRQSGSVRAARRQPDAVPCVCGIPEKHSVLCALHRQFHRQAGTGHCPGSGRFATGLA